MVVCKFWERGNCRNGNSCKFEHPGARSSQGGNNAFGSGSGGQARNPFDTLRNDQSRGPRGGDSYRPEPRRFENDRGRGQAFGTSGQASTADRNFRLDAETIRVDITSELPEWPLSCYSGHPPDVPKHFFPPEMELSPEEVRTEYYLLRLQGQEVQAQQKEASAANAAQQAVAEVVRDIHGAIRRVAAGKRDHPNRWDIVDQNKDLGHPNPFRPTSLPVTAMSGPAQLSTFGQSQGFGQATTPFGQPSSGAQSSGFGQPSRLGQPSSGFGQPSQLGQSSSPFGQASQAASGTFGQPSHTGAGGFGRPSQQAAQNPFGQPAPTQGGSAFGQPSQLHGGSAFGQASQLTSGAAFGQPSQLQSGSAFGKPSSIGTNSPFGQPFGPSQSSAFAQASSVGSTAGFGVPSTPGQTNAFGQTLAMNARSTSGTQNPFGQSGQQMQAANPFGQNEAQTPQSMPLGSIPSTFGQSQGQGTRTFGDAPQLPQQPSGFGQPSGSIRQPANGFANGTQLNNSGFGSSFSALKPTNGFQQQSLEVNTSVPATNGTYTINPPSATPRDSDPPDEMFGSRKKEFEEAYKHVLSTGAFVDGVMPEVAPLHNWVGWGSMEKKFLA